MKKPFMFLLMFIFIFNFTVCSYAVNDTKESDSEESDVKPEEYVPHASSLLAVDINSDMILYEENANRKFSPGSLTRIVTAIVALENCTDLDGTVTVEDGILENFDYDKFNIGLKYGEEITFRNLIEAMLIHDAGDCAIVLGHTVFDSEKEFIDKMNSYATDAGATNTHFSDTSGFDLKNSYTTLNDMNLVSQKIMENKTFASIVSTIKTEIPPTNKYSKERILYNTNNFISTYYSTDYINPKIKGIKTYYNSAEDCGNIAYYSNGHNIMLLLCAQSDSDESSNYAYKDIEYLIDYSLENFTDVTIIKKEEIISEAKINNSDDSDRLLLVSDETLVYKLPVDYKKAQIERKTTLNKNIKAPVKKGEILGKTEAFYNGQKCGEVNLVAYTSVDSSILTYIKHIISSVFSSVYFWIIIILLLALFIIRTININRRKKR